MYDSFYYHPVNPYGSQPITNLSYDNISNTVSDTKKTNSNELKISIKKNLIKFNFNL